MALDENIENTLGEPLFCVYYHYLGLKEAVCYIKSFICHQNWNLPGQCMQKPQS